MALLTSNGTSLGDFKCCRTEMLVIPEGICIKVDVGVSSAFLDGPIATNPNLSDIICTSNHV